MAYIKSALEIALERTSDIKSDAHAGEKRAQENLGKKIASQFLQDGDKDALKNALKSCTSSQKDAFLSGATSLLQARLQLPQDESYTEQLERIANAFKIFYPHSGTDNLFAMLQSVFAQYLATQAQLEEALEQQYLPKLRKKQMELQKQTGAQFELSCKQDPEFLQLLTRNKDNLKAQYQGAIQEAKTRLSEMTGQS